VPRRLDDSSDASTHELAKLTVSRLSDLIARAKASNPQFGADLEAEIHALTSRRAFGLNFERHRPEIVELPGRPVRRLDSVRVLPPRTGSGTEDRDLWVVRNISTVGGVRTAEVARRGAEPSDVKQVPVEDLVVVAAFQDFIYPGLASTGAVARGGDRPFHSVINGENYHVLQALTYTHRGQVDVIYIDPPYNTRDKDWKYNNDYVDSDDQYKHSKWLAMMERRLTIARHLLKPAKSAVIVTIDEREVHRLALLLEQTFPDADIQMVTSVISAKGVVRSGKFSRVEEHIFVATLGEAKVLPWYRNMLDSVKGDGTETAAIEWLGLRRREPSSRRGARPNQFYPIFVDAATGHLHSVGAAVSDDVDRRSVPVPEGTVALWPLKPDGTEMLWGLTPDVLRDNWANGFARVNGWNADLQRGTVQYLPSGTIDLIRAGAITITGKGRDGHVKGEVSVDEDAPPPKRVWAMASHNAELHGTNVLSALVPGRRFPYPKSLYAVEDVLRFVVADEPEAVILDFFSGSGTTAHAVMRLNRQDNGRRQSISVTNNEVAADEQAALRAQGLRAGDREWEMCGICEHITKPRVEAAITGVTPDGDAVSGRYKYTDEFPMADGFAENAEFFTLTYEAPISVSHNLAYQRVAPLLWMRAGSIGRRIDVIPDAGWEVADSYGLLTDLDHASAFADAMRNAPGAKIAYIVTDDELRFQSVAQSLPEHVEAVRLYESYVANFRFAAGD